MPAYTSAWLVGSVTLPAQTFTVNGVAVVLPAGTYYLTDPTPGRSLLAQVAAVMTPQAAGAAAVLLGSGKVRLSAAGMFSLVWGTATTLRDLLGFALGLAASSSYVAPSHSVLWWSAGKPALFALTPLGVTGSRQYIVSQTVAAYTGKAESTSHGSRLFQRFTWEKVDSERMKAAGTDAAVGGEFDAWYAAVAVKSARWKMHHNVAEDPTATTVAVAESVHGPYILPLGGDASWRYQRSAGFTWTDMAADVTIDAHGCPEVT